MNLDHPPLRACGRGAPSAASARAPGLPTVTAFSGVSMESDDRELRLRSQFGFMMVWTALTIGVFGYLAGVLLDAMFQAAGPFFGFAHGERSQAVVQISGHVLVGFGVLLTLVQSYLGHDRLPDAVRGDG